MYLLDTDMLSLLWRGHPRVTERVAQAREDVAIALVTRIEILQGRFSFVLKAENAERLLQAQRRLRESEDDLGRFTVVSIGPTAGDEFDRLRASRRLKSIGRGDILIAAIALAARATLITRNRKDFERVPGLAIENWAD